METSKEPDKCPDWERCIIRVMISMCSKDKGIECPLKDLELAEERRITNENQGTQG